MPSGHDPMGGYRFSLGTNAKRLPGDHAQRANSRAIQRSELDGATGTGGSAVASRVVARG